MSSITSWFKAANIESDSVRAATGGVAAAVATLVAITTVETLLAQVVAIAGLSLVLTLLLSVGYNWVTDTA